jgi:hypothetical protein
MQPESTRRILYQTVIGLWTLALVIICFRTFFFPNTHSVYPIFSNAARNWLAGEDAYFPTDHRNLDQYRYAPVITVLLIPFSFLPDNLGGVIWRLIGIGLMFFAFTGFCKTVWIPTQNFPGGERNEIQNTPKQTWPWLFLFLMPLVLGSVNNGQANIHVLGLLLLAGWALACSRWNLAALSLTLACAFKLYPLAFALLILLLFPRTMTWRLGVFLCLATILPFLCQDNIYVSQAYSSWWNRLTMDDRNFSEEVIGYRDLWLLLRWSVVPINRIGYLGLQLGVALAMALVVVIWKMRENPGLWQIGGVFSLGIGWMVLLGPATETSTYCLMAPHLAWAGAESWLRPRPIWTRLGTLVIFCLFLSNPVSRWFPHGDAWAWAVLPMGGLLLMADRLWAIKPGPDLIRDSSFDTGYRQAA